jgi:hypothetical protein
LKKGSRNIGLKPVQLIHLNTESIQNEIDNNESNGKIGEVDAPMTVPVESRAKQ